MIFNSQLLPFLKAHILPTLFLFLFLFVFVIIALRIQKNPQKIYPINHHFPQNQSPSQNDHREYLKKQKIISLKKLKSSFQSKYHSYPVDQILQKTQVTLNHFLQNHPQNHPQIIQKIQNLHFPLTKMWLKPLKLLNGIQKPKIQILSPPKSIHTNSYQFLPI